MSGDTRRAPVVEWARELQAMSRTGLEYARDEHDIARYERLRDLAAEMVAFGSEAPVDRVREAFRRELGHATPKIDVRAFVQEVGTDRVLLVRERSDGLWTLPGGFADPTDTPSASIAREVVEESGFRVDVTRLLALHDRDMHVDRPHPYRIYKLFFACRIVGGAAATSAETDGVDFFSLDELPPLSVGRVTAAQLSRLAELNRNPSAPTEFD
jgi:ADP-ribose pyrophosphatase YjhB (NUDIX family)